MTLPEMNIYSPECDAVRKKAQCERAQLLFGSQSPDPNDHRELSPPIPHFSARRPSFPEVQIEIDNEDDNGLNGLPDLLEAPSVEEKKQEKPVHSTKTIREFFYWMMNQVISIVCLIVNIVWKILCGIFKIVYDMIMGIFGGERICISKRTLMLLLTLAALVWMSYPNSSSPTPSPPKNQSLTKNQTLPAPSPPKKNQCKIGVDIVCTDGGKTAEDHPNCKNREVLTGVLYNNHVKSANQTMSNGLKLTGTALAILGSRYLETFAFFQVFGPGQVLAAGCVAAGAYVAQEVTAAYDKHHKKKLEMCGTVKMFHSTRI